VAAVDHLRQAPGNIDRLLNGTEKALFQPRKLFLE